MLFQKRKRLLCVLLISCMVLSLTACGKKCENGCGQPASSKCMAGMCDNCCQYWMGLNGCYAEH